MSCSLLFFRQKLFCELNYILTLSLEKYVDMYKGEGDWQTASDRYTVWT